MKRILILGPAVIAALLAAAVPPAVAAPPSTLAATSAARANTNAYTPAEERRARAAAARAGYRTEAYVWAQAGSLFLTGAKGPQRYPLTVTPDGRLHAGPALPAARSFARGG